MRTRVVIIGAGPGGLMLAHLLHLYGLDSMVLECRDRNHVEHRGRAGVLESPTVDLLRETGLGDRLAREGLPHRGLSLRFEGLDHRVALEELTGRFITMYGQQEVVKDLITARLAADAPLLFEVSGVRLHDLASDRPRVTFVDATGAAREVLCEVVAGCDGFHGVSRASAPAGALTEHHYAYPFAWLGVLARAAPSHHELVYAYSERGFALHSMRSADITRLYLQVDPGQRTEWWPDDRIWAELDRRLAAENFTLNTGPILERTITTMRGFVVEPMRYGRLFLAGDAAHLVPPIGAKGMNLAVADAWVLARALHAFFAQRREDLLDGYAETCLRRVWRAEHFAWWLMSMLHSAPGSDRFTRRLQESQLRYAVSSTAARTSIAENYVGLPFESA